MSTCTYTITIKKIVFRSHFHIKYVTLVETAAKMVRWSFRRTLKYHTIVTPCECDDVNARNVDRPLSISVFNKLDACYTIIRGHALLYGVRNRTCVVLSRGRQPRKRRVSRSSFCSKCIRPVSTINLIRSLSRAPRVATCPLLFDVRPVGRTTRCRAGHFFGMSPHFDRGPTVIDNDPGRYWCRIIW